MQRSHARKTELNTISFHRFLWQLWNEIQCRTLTACFQILFLNWTFSLNITREPPTDQKCWQSAESTTTFFFASAAAAAKSLQSCPTLCDPIDGSLPGSSVPGILQARALEWVAISFSNAWKWKVKVKSLSRVRLLATPWTVAHQAPPSMGFSRQEVLEWVAIFASS